MSKLYIIDAVNFLFRSYYAIGPMTNSEGQSTSALYGFIRSVQKLIKDFSIENLVCVFDGPDNKKSRRAVYADYKMHRKGAPEDLFPQFEWAYSYCALSGIPTLCVEGVEADDTMASVALWAAHHNIDAYICTSDKDLMQMVGDHVFMIHAHKDNLLVDAATVKELFGVKPEQMLDYLAIVGDASDNIPGISGFGPKTASSLLQEFGTLDEILAHPEKVKGEKKQQELRAQKEQALMSRELASLDMQVQIPKNIDFYRKQLPDIPQLTAFFHQMQFHSLLKELDRAPYMCTKQEYVLVDTEEGVEKLLEQLAREKEVCIDTETTDTSPMLAVLVGIGFSVQPAQAWYIPCNGQLGREKVLRSLRDFFRNAQCSFYGHNIKYDWHVLQNSDIFLSSISFDTLVASYVLNPQNRKHNLDELTLECFQHVKIPIENLIGKGKQQISMQDVPVEQVTAYCCEDADYTTRLKQLFSAEMAKRQLEEVFFKIEMPLLPILAKMERWGIYLDAQKLHKIGEELVTDLEKLKEAIFFEAKEVFNINSPKQLSDILFQKLQLKMPARKKSSFSTSADVLEELEDAHPIVRQVLEYRGLEKLRSTYVEALPQFIHLQTGRIHCTFNQSVAATGRLSSQNPNLQNIPIRTKEGLAIRSCFVPQKPNWSYVGGDYSQIELRILAHFSEDAALLKAFREKQDIHTYTASLIYGIAPEMITNEMRSLAKTVNFGILYGQGPYGLSRQLKIPMKVAAEFIDKYFERYPKVLAYLESCKEAVRKTKMATTLMHRQRPIPDIDNPNPSIRALAERLAINTPLQGTAADLIKLAMIAIDREIMQQKLEGRMILQIHDELIFEVPDHEIPIFTQLVKEKMEGALPLNVPIEVHIAVGKNWGAC